MDITRRRALAMLAGLAPAIKLSRVLGQTPETEPSLDIEPGPFQGTRQSLQAYQPPDWFKDAKFGIWAHWGPQSSVEYGDWYARQMYMQGSKQNMYHLANYGHPSKFGYKDLIPLWHARDFDPDYLMGLYKKAGAKYFFSMAVHHDNFDLWNSRHTRWNAVNMGPKIDVVGLWKKAAQKHGLKFGVSDHLWISYKWFSTSHGADADGPFDGVPYDGTDPRFADLYQDVQQIYAPNVPWNDDDIPKAWKQKWFLRIKDLVDQYQPDVLYCDGPIPFEEYGLSILAHLYNQSARLNGGQVQSVYTSKRLEDSKVGTCVLDVERGVVDGIWPTCWETDTCVGNWHYDKTATYKTPKTVIDLLVDIVSRNGNLMLNFPLPNSGMLDDRELAILDGITKWMEVNSSAIYATRPWKIYGSGPAAAPAAPSSAFNERARKDLTAQDVRFTTKSDALYAFCMDWPDSGQAVFTPLASTTAGKIQHVELLGFDGQLQWTQDAGGLKVQLPAQKPCDYAITFKVIGAKEVLPQRSRRAQR
jgi:alpha-L-fucosidase